MAHPNHSPPSPTCQVCGDKSIGCNYEVSSCYGCKTFFRRTIQAERRFVCRQNGRCKQAYSREMLVRCRACRFDLCVDAGMNPLAINSVTDPESNELVREILQRRTVGAQGISKSSNDSRLAVLHQPPSLECRIDGSLRELLLLENAHQKLRRSRFNPDPHNLLVTMPWVLQGPSRLGSDYGVGCKDMPFRHPPLPLHMTYIPVEIRVRDRIKYVHIREDIAANPTYKKWSVVDLIYTIEWLKTLAVFQQLTEREKAHFQPFRLQIKAIARMVASFTAAFWSYEQRNSEVTIMPDGMVLIEGELPREAHMDRAYYFEIIHRIRTLKMDKQEYVLIKGIMACEPVHDPFGFSQISQAQLQRQGPSAFIDMLSLVEWLTRIIRRSKELYVLISAFRLKRATVPAVMDEIFLP